MTTELIDDVFAVLESTRLPLTMGDIIQDVAVLPVGRGEPMRKASPKDVAAEIQQLIHRGKIESGIPDGGAELVYRLTVEKKPMQRGLF